MMSFWSVALNPIFFLPSIEVSLSILSYANTTLPVSLSISLSLQFVSRCPFYCAVIVQLCLRHPSRCLILRLDWKASLSHSISVSLSFVFLSLFSLLCHSTSLELSLISPMIICSHRALSHITKLPPAPCRRQAHHHHTHLPHCRRLSPQLPPSSIVCCTSPL